jgi:hypothetical protein
MKKETIFVNGMMFKEPKENAPEWIKGIISIKVADLIRFLTEHENHGWVNIDLKEGKSGKKYFQLNTYGQDRDKSESKQYESSLSEQAKNDLKAIKEANGMSNVVSVSDEDFPDGIPF